MCSSSSFCKVLAMNSLISCMFLSSFLYASTYFFIFFCAAFFLTICSRFMAFSWDSWEVGALSPGAPLCPLPLFPLPPPLLLPLEPVWALLGEPAPDGEDTFPGFSVLDERLTGCFPKVRGGGGLRVTWLEPFPLLFPTTFPPASPDLAPASPDNPTGFWLGAVKVLLLPLAPEEASLELAGREGFVLAPNAAQPVRPLLEEEDVEIVELANVTGGCVTKKKKEKRIKVRKLKDVTNSSHFIKNILNQEATPYNFTLVSFLLILNM